MPPRPPRRRDGRRFFHRRKVCAFCVDKIKIIDYKDVPRLRRYISEWAKIESHRRTGTCPPHQRALATAIKRARYVALLPYTGGHSLVPLGFGDSSRGDRFRRDRGPFRPPAPAAPSVAQQVTPVAPPESPSGVAIAEPETAVPETDTAPDTDTDIADSEASNPNGDEGGPESSVDTEASATEAGASTPEADGASDNDEGPS